MSAAAFVCQEDTLHCQLICQRRCKDRTEKKKALLIFYLLLLGPQGEADHTHQSRRNGINFLI